METPLRLDKYRQCLDSTCTIQANGKVTNIVGLVIEAQGPVSKLGTVCDIYTKGDLRKITAEVLGFRDDKVMLMPLEEMRGIGPGCPIVARQQKAVIPVGSGLLGRVVDGLGNPIDNKGPITAECEYPIYGTPVNPLSRQRITKPLDLGIRAINGLLTLGCGQRIGIFAGSGVGKSVLLGMIARKTAADVNVIALIGERGREVNEFIEKELGAEGLKRSVIVVATSDHLPLIRMRGAFIATAIAEFFRDQGHHVNLMMDSVTRFAMAQREIGLALGEPPTTKGYTPSVFTLLPKLCERAGTSANRGTITGLYTVLVEGDDTNEPIADALRSILDGHINLSRDLANHAHYPAIDVLGSVSRVMEDIVEPKQKSCARKLKEVMATYRRAEDLINIGAYVAGSNPKIDYAIAMMDKINRYLKQDIDETSSFEDCISQLADLFEA
jgi:flagellum-specific ATP synthase